MRPREVEEVSAIAVWNSVDMMKQALVLARRPHIVIATPGRLADHLQSSPDIALAFKKIKILVRVYKQH